MQCSASASPSVYIIFFHATLGRNKSAQPSSSSCRPMRCASCCEQRCLHSLETGPQHPPETSDCRTERECVTGEACAVLQVRRKLAEGSRGEVHRRCAGWAATRRRVHAVVAWATALSAQPVQHHRRLEAGERPCAAAPNADAPPPHLPTEWKLLHSPSEPRCGTRGGVRSARRGVQWRTVQSNGPHIS